MYINSQKEETTLQAVRERIKNMQKFYREKQADVKNNTPIKPEEASCKRKVNKTIRKLFYDFPYILTKKQVEDILRKNKKSYSFNELTRKSNRVLTTIKRGKLYANKASKEIPNPFVLVDLFMGDIPYVFGWLLIWNRLGLSEQVAVWGQVYNTKYSWYKQTPAGKVLFEKVSLDYFYGIERINVKVWTGSYMQPTLERAIIQMVEEWGSIYPSRKELPMRGVYQMVKENIQDYNKRIQLLKKISTYNYFGCKSVK